ncbi:nitroreductase [Corynebacterium sp. 320]|uniref:Nitroreductase n=1 Tax=Corynebacterium zhongnanshanii TaxID=2768834 RepID=A0ABQ6VF28_9CORY|nr:MULTISPECIES: nitroreductase [Corynebacterium]KAB1502433.1 nitroreductase [Corynebacterium sp. 320]KAB1551346.1 nitroreductase [Corynebacterium sp. 321]KAB1551825.1 nitroreductase [Corynebacterium sp. 319]KAB3520886.1 nitroreductase [Corynebacterium zhongnanshanii]KAB3526040.1 nitroreductase [Corynebacterium sp. 250]
MSTSDFIRHRHSPRAFLPDPIPNDVLKNILLDAQSAPSNSNTQPWHVHVVSGQRLRDLSAALIEEFDTNGLNPDFTTDYGQGVHPRRSQELAAKVYGLKGIAREDKEGRTEFLRENLRFFGAPYSAMLFIPPMGDRIRAAFDQGTYAENFLLSLEAHGYHGIPQGMISLLAPTVREFLGVDEDYKLVTALTFGRGDESSPMFRTEPGRVPLSETVTAHGIEGLEL